MSTPLDPIAFPLHGTRLVEASAGTGKTYTLAALYVRLVLNHGGGNAAGRPLLPPEILVVTFTEAATRELRERIRDRLAEAARCFAGRASPAPGDRFLNELLADYDPADHAAQADWLETAAQWMDEAAVFTIHGFSQRMLRQHAFDSGSLFNLTLTQDEAHLLEEATRDYWRTFCHDLDREAAGVLCRAVAASNNAVAATPTDLLDAVRPLLNDAGDLPEPADDDLARLLGRLASERRRILDELKRPWRHWAPELLEAFEAAWAEKRLPRGKPSRASDIQRWLRAIEAWANDPEAVNTGLTATPFRNLTPEALRQHGTGIDALANHDAWQALPALEKPGDQLPAERPPVLVHAARWISARVDASKRSHGVMGFQDMLTRLDEALAADGGERLAQTIRRQYPVALIDEFQDTDPVQYRIFARCYADQPGTGWFMIGDPKQAIYGFRGADIYTYLDAKDQATGGTYTLPRNYRSAVDLVNAVNRLFSSREQTAGAAFLLDERIPFQPVEAAGSGESLEILGAQPPGMTLWHLVPEGDDSSLSKTDYIAAMAGRTASYMTALLNGAAQGTAGLRGDNGWRALRSGDMAVLVRDRQEADAIRRALAQRGVGSVYLSDQESVFRTGEALDLLRWLRACAAPDSEQRVRAALATATLGLSWARLDALASDERQWETAVQRFHDYQRLWQRRGVLPMLRRLIHDHELPARLLAAGDERRLTNLLHLAELCQDAAVGRDGEPALVRWLEEQVNSQGQPADTSILRLESDADRVQVITVHKSKGLEYPLVFLPFACTFRAEEGKKPPVRYHGKDGARHIELEPDALAIDRADRERLAEDLRLLYVAATRARYACWLGIGPLRSGGGKDRTDLDRSAMGYLLAGGDTIPPGELRDRLEALAAPEPGMAVADAPAITREAVQWSDAGEGKLAAARPYRGLVLERWWIGSYSALQPQAREGDRPEPASAGAEVISEESDAAAETFRASTSDRGHGFLRGP
ncbi:MAG: exodeoxyribonuclease V subunit beta, partial [Ectothiorhodospiraceae bacterium]